MFDFTSSDVLSLATTIAGLFSVVVLVVIGKDVAVSLLSSIWRMFNK